MIYSHSKASRFHGLNHLLEGKGRKRSALVLIERKSQYVTACLLPRKDAGEALSAAQRFLGGMRVKSITTDNSTEFACCQQP